MTVNDKIDQLKENIWHFEMCIEGCREEIETLKQEIYNEH